MGHTNCMNALPSHKHSTIESTMQSLALPLVLQYFVPTCVGVETVGKTWLCYGAKTPSRKRLEPHVSRTPCRIGASFMERRSGF